jgi:uncharacterized protein YhdP
MPTARSLWPALPCHPIRGRGRLRLDLLQPEIAIRSGKLQWVDELRNAAPLQLQDVDLVLRNKRWHHSLRLDATPPEGWGQRFTVMGNFKEPLLSVHEGRLERWSGQAYLDFTHIDLSHLGQYLDPQDWKLQQGKGSVRAWLDVERGQPVGGVADVAVQALQLQWRDRPEPLALQALRGACGPRIRTVTSFPSRDCSSRPMTA